MSARPPKRICPRPDEMLDAPFPSMADCIRATLRSLTERPERAPLYQEVVWRHLDEARR